MGRQRSKNFSSYINRSEVNMKFRKFCCALIVALFSLQSLPFTARADEGSGL